MIQRTVRNGRVRAFGAEWELDELALEAFQQGDTVHVVEGVRGKYVTLWTSEEGVRVYGHATRRPVVDLMANLRDSLSAKADQ